MAAPSKLHIYRRCVGLWAGEHLQTPPRHNLSKTLSESHSTVFPLSRRAFFNAQRRVFLDNG